MGVIGYIGCLLKGHDVYPRNSQIYICGLRRKEK